MIVVFDLDDTLYDELTYVQSGFRAVAGYLRDAYGISADKALDWMMGRLAGGRGTIFDDLLREAGIYSQRRVRKCLAVYRSHPPQIQLDPAADACLTRLARLGYPLYIVTDGHKGVQDRKLCALGLRSRVSHCYITHRYGKRHAKPSSYCFQKICVREGASPDQVVYVADNPHKDFVGIKPLGFKTVRLMRGQHREVEKPPAYEADLRIASLDELTPAFLSSL